jgi:hypothetical protein
VPLSRAPALLKLSSTLTTEALTGALQATGAPCANAVAPGPMASSAAAKAQAIRPAAKGLDDIFDLAVGLKRLARTARGPK